ncbi:MAG: DNA recombination protein RmuC [Candidatus Enterosoma sp.]|nr:DNA recombination protein RmuC [Candidatus Enterosoma sp.]
MELSDIILIVLIVLLIIIFAVGMTLIFVYINHMKKQLPSDNKEIESLKKEQREQMDRFYSLQQDQMIKFQSAMNDSFLSGVTKLKESVNNDVTNINKTLSDIISSFQLKTSENVSDSFTKVNTSIEESLRKGFEQNNQNMLQFERKMAELESAQANLLSAQKQMTSVAELLTSNKARGKYGELQLTLLLEDVFGPTKGTFYDVQKEFTVDGKILRPDAVIYLCDEHHRGVVPIDSKFSLIGYEELIKDSDPNKQKEAKKTFQTALKARVDEVMKYHVKSLMVDTAILYLPSDGIFAYVQTEMESISQYARNNNVIFASPSTLPPLLASFKMLLLERKQGENVKQIQARLAELSTEFSRFTKRWENIDSRLTQLMKDINDFDITVRKISKSFQKIESLPTEEKHEPGETE